ncbi:MAG: outer membrane beta-barrel protein [Myxococcales bacterium]|jgi:opacity protein-like surface antigen|nr:outer membrane beta-barrel protein [Myxococcales bacterium]
MKHRLAKSLTVAATLTLALVASRTARADDCPPGSWFCGQGQAGGQQGGQLQPLPPPTAAPPPAAPAPAAAPPPVVVYNNNAPTAAPPPVREAPPPYVYAPAKQAWPRKNEWGLNLHLGGAFFGKGRTGDAGAGVLGAGLRYKPIPQAGIQADLDLAGGRDYNGFRRGEVAFTINGLIFVNPKDKAQLYFLGGFGWAGATAVDDRNGYDERTYRYGYFGVQTGIGLEFRPTKNVALNADLRGFIRGRTDSARHTQPEFVDDRGRSTNASGGGLLTGGITFYF